MRWLIKKTVDRKIIYDPENELLTWEIRAENDSSTHHTMKKVIKELGKEDVLSRVTPNLQAFADAPRDIRMDTAKSESFGIKFSTTTEGLVEALRRVL